MNIGQRGVMTIFVHSSWSTSALVVIAMFIYYYFYV